MNALRPKPRCPQCGDSGWYTRGLVSGPNGTFKSDLVRCDCRHAEDVERKQRKMQAFDGLTTLERKRRFNDIDDNYAPGVLHQLRTAIDTRRGFVTLTGKFGVGKTMMLQAAVNEGRESDHLSIYTTVTDLLTYLRSTFDPSSEQTFDDYWDALIKCDILCLDEMDEFNATSWAMERFLRLIDERWRRMDTVLTMCALNGSVRALPGKVQSRLHDGRAEIIDMGTRDMRPLKGWE